ncbi:MULTISPECIES: helix-turn-helix domain-containing protein [Thermus]|jgi:excisionase family DNA binding protein|uniref:helix-turn-helix domain-containing protein n=1 Tax=Thermus thalpophilus TaxID=2908147 RepID=UPI001FAB2608|nr:helix-turn-helix domain-containing protein [Thermus thalpophilus]
MREGSEEFRDPLGGRLLLTYAEVQRALGVSRTTVWRLVQKGSLKVVYPTSGSPRITRESLEAFLRSLSSGEIEGRGRGKPLVDRAKEVLRRFGL